MRLIFDAPLPQKTLGRFRLAMTASADLESFIALRTIFARFCWSIPPNAPPHNHARCSAITANSLSLKPGIWSES